MDAVVAAVKSQSKQQQQQHRRADTDDDDPLVGKIIDSSKTVEDEVRVLLGLAGATVGKPRKAATAGGSNNSNSSSHQRSYRNKTQRRPKTSSSGEDVDTDRRLYRTSSQDSSKNSAKQSRRRKLATETRSNGPEAVGNEPESAGGKVVRQQRRMSNIRKSSRRNLTQQDDLPAGTHTPGGGGLSASLHNFPSPAQFDSAHQVPSENSGKRNRGRRQSYNKMLSLSNLHTGRRSKMVKHGSLREVHTSGASETLLSGNSVLPTMDLKRPVRHPSDSDKASGKLQGFAIHEDLASFGRRPSFKRNNNNNIHQEQRPTMDGPEANRNSSRSLLLKPPPKDTKKTTEKRKTVVKQRRESMTGKKQPSLRKRASDSAGEGKSRLSRQRDQLRRGKREVASTSSAELNSSAGSFVSVSTDTSSITLLSFEEDFDFPTQSETNTHIATPQTEKGDGKEKNGEKEDINSGNHEIRKGASKEKKDTEEIGNTNGRSPDDLKKGEVPKHNETQTTSKTLNPSAEKLISESPDILSNAGGDRAVGVVTASTDPSEDSNLPSDLPRTNRPYARRKSSFKKGAILSFLRSASDGGDQAPKAPTATPADTTKGDKSSIAASETDKMMRDESSSPGSEADTLISSVAAGSLQHETLSEPFTRDNPVAEEVIVPNEEEAAGQFSGSDVPYQTPATGGADSMRGDDSSLDVSEADTLISSCASGSALKHETLPDKSGSLYGNPTKSGKARAEEANVHDEPAPLEDLSSLCTPDNMFHESATSIGAGSLRSNSRAKSDDEGSFGVEESPISKARNDIGGVQDLLPTESEGEMNVVESVQEATNDGRWEASPKRNNSDSAVPMLTDNRLCNVEPISPASSVSGSHSQFSPTGSESKGLKFDRWEAETPINHSNPVLSNQEKEHESLPFCIDLSNGGTAAAESGSSHPVADRWAANSGETPIRRRSLGAVYMGSHVHQDSKVLRNHADAGGDQLPLLKQRRSLGHVTGNSMVHSIFTKEELERLEMTGDFDFGYGARDDEHDSENESEEESENENERRGSHISVADVADAVRSLQLQNMELSDTASENERRESHISVADVADAVKSLQRENMELSDTASESTGILKETDSHHKAYNKIIAQQAAVRQSIMSHKMAISALEEELEQLEQELQAI